MEAELEAVILAGADEEEIEHIILHNIFIDRGITHTAQFNLETCQMKFNSIVHSTKTAGISKQIV
ncbi:unnamed protein product [Acanthoscelides obtectus]|uniref:Uncharacterized protein n=1 Tax=Acanthoscelides obtectus TaxID=200917 RepID=A0A9P0K9T3_ACAOB|nr:unnamed protein product [Acanthoscelides obtectus]CAK1662378.1 hypothetical protein AOBTE_LOCUS23113 [Acanthoscelides obtectus]